MPPSADDPVARALAEGLEAIAGALRAQSAVNLVIVIDGRSGACKTSLSRLVLEHWPLEAPAQLVALDSIYPGWDGLDEGVERALHDILLPHDRGDDAIWRRWDWVEDREAEAHTVDHRRGLILEGCGALTPQTAPLADVRVWVESPDAARKARALARDGDGFRAQWDRWAAQEERHIERDDPRSLADVIVRVP